MNKLWREKNIMRAEMTGSFTEKENCNIYIYSLNTGVNEDGASCDLWPLLTHHLLFSFRQITLGSHSLPTEEEIKREKTTKEKHCDCGGSGREWSCKRGARAGSMRRTQHIRYREKKKKSKPVMLSVSSTGGILSKIRNLFKSLMFSFLGFLIF